MALPSRWKAAPYRFEAADALARELGVSHPTASILARRGHDTPAAARRFLAADERHSPFGFEGIGAACDLILSHVQRGGRIVVHGDYDVDGVCSTAILVRALRALGAEPRWHLPARADGYGLSEATVERLARERTDLLITADCAITAVAEVALARSLGVDVVVSDHHRPGVELPACPIVHPAICAYPCEHLCAAGVAHKLAEALFEVAGLEPALAPDDLDLVALATIADVVPLQDENRRLVREGLVALARTPKLGLRALMRVSRLDPGDVDERAVGFRLAPRINAAGRLQRADAALELVLTEDAARAEAVADELDLLNRERQDTETRILFAAEAARSEHPEAAAYVLAGEGWHPGVIGIVAGRLVERYHRPCVVIALDGDRGRGSGRSIGAYDLHAGLAACAEHLARFGGHPAAAGVEIDSAAVNDFRAALAAHAASKLTPEDLVGEERVDAVVPADRLGTDLAEELERLRPFGHGNPTPTLLVPAVRVGDVRAMGEDGQHSRFTLSGAGGHARAVAFRTAARTLASASDEAHDAAVRLELNEWRGTVEPRLVLRALCPSAPGSVDVLDLHEPFWEAFQRALAARLDAPSLAEPPAVRVTLAAAAGAGGGDPAAPVRALRECRGSGFAGVVGDLLTTGADVLIVCADAGRRKAALERVVAGMPAGCDQPMPARLALVGWEVLMEDPRRAAPFAHVVVLDPPPSATAHELIARLPCPPAGGHVHLAWGPAELEFSRAVIARSLDLRADLVELYRDLRAAGDCAGEVLERVLRGGARRSPQLAARLLRVLTELGLAAYEPGLEGPACRLLDAGRTDLERSAAFRAYSSELAAASAYLDSLAPLAA